MLDIDVCLNGNNRNIVLFRRVYQRHCLASATNHSYVIYDTILKLRII